MAKSCRNPECVNGLTPGVAIQGKGNKDKPVLGQIMRWGWVRCSFCNPKANDPDYPLVKRTDEDIAQRAEMASKRMEYKPKSAISSRLGNLASRAAQRIVPPPENSALMAKMDKLIEGQGELLDQIRELRAENRELKAENARLKSGVNEKVAAQAKPS